MHVNEIDSFIDDYEAYAAQFSLITGRDLTYTEYTQIRDYLAERITIKPPAVEWADCKAFSDLFDEVHPYFRNTFHIPMLIQAIWAEYVGIISTRELDEINKKWRTAR